MLLEKLVERQRQLGLSDIQFAKKLRVPRSTWQLTRTGRIQLGSRVAKATQRAFPELAPDVVYFLLSDASPLAEAAS